MKKDKKFLAYLVLLLAGLSILSTQCKKDDSTTESYSVTGNATYPDYTGTKIAAAGAVVRIYTGSAATGDPLSTTIANASGNYSFNNLVAGMYFITSTYNNENQNLNKAIEGINFVTIPGYAVNIESANITQNISLVSYTTSSTLKVSLDTVNNVGYRPLTWEIHSKCDFAFPDHATGVELPGGFNNWKVDQFVFDAANPANTKISGWVTLSSVSTLEPVRDDLLNNGCVPKTFLINVDSVNQVAVPATDTARFTSISVEKYGDGYVAHGTLTAFYHDGPSMAYPADTNYTIYTNGFANPVKASVPTQYWNTRVSKPCDLYFVYQGKFPYSKNADGSTKNLYFGFEGEFVIYPQADYYISSSHFAESPIKVNAHVGFLGAINDTNYPD